MRTAALLALFLVLGAGRANAQDLLAIDEVVARGSSGLASLFSASLIAIAIGARRRHA